MRDPAVRAALVEGGDGARGLDGWREFYVLTPERGARYDCDPADSLAAHAERAGTSAVEAYVDLCLATDGAVVLNWPVLNQDFGVIAEMLSEPLVMMGLADAGAHVGQILDASQPTFFLSYWVRERGLVSVAEGVRRLTSEPAGFMGIADRGVVAPGMKADLNVHRPRRAVAAPADLRPRLPRRGRTVRPAGRRLRLDGGERRGAHGGRRAHRHPARAPARGHLGGW